MELCCCWRGGGYIGNEIFRGTNQFHFHFVHQKTKSTELLKVPAGGTYTYRRALNG